MILEQFNRDLDEIGAEESLHGGTTVVVQTEDGLIHEIKEFKFETHEDHASTLFIKVEEM